MHTMDGWCSERKARASVTNSGTKTEKKWSSLAQSGYVATVVIDTEAAIRTRRMLLLSALV